MVCENLKEKTLITRVRKFGDKKALYVFKNTIVHETEETIGYENHHYFPRH